MAADKSEKQERGDRWSKDKGWKVHFASLMDVCHLKNAELEPQFQMQRQSRFPTWHCNRWFWCVRSIHWTRIISISNDSRQYHGYHLQIACLRWTSSRCSIRLYLGQNGRCSQIIENSKIGVSRHLDSSTTTQMAKIMVRHGRSSRSSWSEICTDILEQECYGKGIFEKVLLEHGWEKVPNRECLFVHREKRTFLISVCGGHQIGWQHKTSIRLGKYQTKTSIWENQNHFLTMFIQIAVKENVRLAKILWIITEVCSNTGFPLEPRKKLPTRASGKLDAEAISSR